MLFEIGITDREKRLMRRYKKNWHLFKPNERLAIESMNYNVESIVSTGTNFFKQLNLYYNKKRTNPIESKAALNMARWEIRIGSNPKNNKGIQDRRNAEEIMFNSSGSSLFMPQTEKEKHSEEIILKLNALECGTLPIDNMFSMLREAMMQAYKKGPIHTRHLTIGPNEDDYSKIDAGVEQLLSDYKLSFAHGYSQIMQKINRKFDRITSDAYSVTYADDLAKLKKELAEEHSKTIKKLYDDIQEEFRKDLEEAKQGKF